MDWEIAGTMRSRLLGLFGRPGFSGVLMLVPCHDIHTFGMRKPIDVAFVAADGTVIEAHRNVAPCHRLKNCDAVATLERFAADTRWFAPGDLIDKPATASTSESGSGSNQQERFSASFLPSQCQHSA